MNSDSYSQTRTSLANSIITRLKGGVGSGNFGHAGRPGKVGGSAPNPVAAGKHKMTGEMKEKVYSDGTRSGHEYVEDTKKFYLWMTTRGGDIQIDQFDPAQEYDKIMGTLDYVRSVISSKEGKKLAKGCDEYLYSDPKELDAANQMRVSMNIIFTAQDKDIGAGSGGLRSARVFWLPYSNAEGKRAGVSEGFPIGSLGIDGTFVLVHELHHAFGSDSELDAWSTAVAIGRHYEMGNKLMTRAVDYEVTTMIYHARSTSRKKYMPKIRREARATFVFLKTRHPKQLRESFVRYYSSEEEADKIMEVIDTWK